MSDEKLEKLMDDLTIAVRSIGDSWIWKADQISAARAALRAHVSEDTRRLDWLEKQGCIELSLNRSGLRPEFFALDQGDRCLARGESLRATIDSARRASMKEHPDD